DLANWQCDILHKPYKPALIGILGEPIDYSDMWNPDAVLRVEDIKHKDNTQDRLDKAAATQIVFEDALMHVLAHYIKTTRCDRLVFTGGLGLNALANMRLLEHFDDDWFRREMGRPGRLHLSAPPTWAPILPVTASAPLSNMPSIAACRRRRTTSARHSPPIPTSPASRLRPATARRCAPPMPISWPT